MSHRACSVGGIMNLETESAASSLLNPSSPKRPALLDRHEQVVLGGELRHQAGIDRLCEARVGDRHGDVLALELLGGGERLAHARAVADQRDTAAGARAGVAVLCLAQDLARADR